MPTAPHQKLVRYWQDTGAEMRTTAVDEATIANLERKYGIQMPSEFRAYLLNTSPLDNEVDKNFTEWWSLNRIKNIPDEYEHELTDPEIAEEAAGFLFFADYGIWCMAWAICCCRGENYGRVAVISGKDRFVANTFGEFVDSYIRDHRQLL
jgi:SMI1 / KNR4 family (SUKH-1)